MMDNLSWKDRTVDMPMDPENWFMSSVSDPYDFDHDPARFMPQIVTALVPYSDDVLVVLCENSSPEVFIVAKGQP